MTCPIVVFASYNHGKFRELQSLLKDVPLQLIPIYEVTHEKIHVLEDGNTYEENAIKKAKTIATKLGLPTLADDSGLEVDTLNGAPGIYSARYAHEFATDTENNHKLLDELKLYTTLESRRARFRCVLVLMDPNAHNLCIITQGICEGRIAHTPKGNHGFGYDPLVVVNDLGGQQTMAELSTHEKDQISHRAKATFVMKPFLQTWVQLQNTK